MSERGWGPASPERRSTPTETIDGRFVVDCSGRAGIVARNGLRAREPGDATLALVGIWRSAGGWPLADETHTLVEAYRDGWAWSIPISKTVRYCTFMVDWRETALARGRGLEATYRAEMEKTERFRAIFEAGALEGPPWSCDASLYSARCYAGPRFLLVGDAGSFIDPLSSFGVKKALASAWIGAVTVNTCLANPAMRAAALEFFSNRERQVYAGFLRQRAHHVRAAASRYPHPFWIRRSDAKIDATLWDADEEELKRDAEVLAAFAALKEAPSIRLRLAGGARVGEGPGVADRELVMEERLIGPGIPSGVRFLGGVNVPELVRIADAHRQVPDLYGAYNRVALPVALPNFLGALSVLLAKGVLRNEA